MISLAVVHQKYLEKGYALQPYEPEDYPQLYELFKIAIEKKDTLPWDDASEEEFKRRFMNENSNVYVLKHLNSSDVAGGLSFKAKRAGRCAHVAKVLYLRSRQHAGKGLSELMVQASLFYAKAKDFHSLQSCLVDVNQSYQELFRKTGFEMNGFIKSGIRTKKGTFTNAFFFQRDLENVRIV